MYVDLYMHVTGKLKLEVQGAKNGMMLYIAGSVSTNYVLIVGISK